MLDGVGVDASQIMVFFVVAVLDETISVDVLKETLITGNFTKMKEDTLERAMVVKSKAN